MNRYGYRAEDASNLDEIYVNSRSHVFFWVKKWNVVSCLKYLAFIRLLWCLLQEGWTSLRAPHHPRLKKSAGLRINPRPTAWGVAYDGSTQPRSSVGRTWLTFDHPSQFWQVSPGISIPAGFWVYLSVSNWSVLNNCEETITKLLLPFLKQTTTCDFWGDNQWTFETVIGLEVRRALNTN